RSRPGGRRRGSPLAIRARTARKQRGRDVGPPARGVSSQMRSIALRYALATIALCLLASPVIAQQRPAEPPPTLTPVVVETPRLAPERRQTEEQAREEIQRVPGGVDLIPQKQIEESRAANLKDVLDFTPGVMIRPRFGAADESQLSVRGSGLRD